MPSYCLEAGDLLHSDPGDYYELARRIAERVLRESGVETVRFRGLADALRDSDPEAFDRVSEKLGDKEGWVGGELPGEYAGDILDLYGGGLTKVVLVGDEPVYALLDDAQIYFELPVSAVEELGLTERVRGLGDSYQAGVLAAVAEWDDEGVNG